MRACYPVLNAVSVAVRAVSRHCAACAGTPRGLQVDRFCGSTARSWPALAGHLNLAGEYLAAPAMAEDAVQDTMIAIHEKRHTYDVCCPFEPWLAAVARY